jgi:hypothetical protein
MSFFSWVPYNKGGPARKWSNNSTLCVYWKHNGLAESPMEKTPTSKRESPGAA